MEQFNPKNEKTVSQQQTFPHVCWPKMTALWKEQHRASVDKKKTLAVLYTNLRNKVLFKVFLKQCEGTQQGTEREAGQGS